MAENQLTTESVRQRQPTIAFFSSSPGGAFRHEKWQVWRGIAEAARELGYNLIYLAGEEFQHHPQAVLYDIVDAANVDGLVIWQSFVGPSNTPAEMQAFLERYQSLPIVCIESALANCGSVLLDNYQGIQDVLAHLIENHGYKRVAYVYNQANLTACERRDALELILKKYNLFDPALFGTLEELDGRGLRPGTDYQAVLAQSDDWAIRVIESLRQRGVSVPEDVAVTGFNDGQDARGALPPLTTVRIPFRMLGRQAVELLAQKLAASKPKRPIAQSLITLPLQLITRRSCGCLEPMAEQAAVGKIALSPSSASDALTRQQKTIVDDMRRHMGTPIASLAAQWAEDLFALFASELQSYAMDGQSDLPSRDYLEGLNDLLQQAIAEDGNISRWHEALTVLRKHLRPYLKGDDISFAEDLLHQARVLVGQTAMRLEIHRSWQTAQRAQILREIQAGLLMSFDENELLDVLSKGLPRLGISSFYLVQYAQEEKFMGWSRLLLAYQDGSLIRPEVGEMYFPTRQILPQRWLPESQPYGLVVEALHLREEQLGYLVFNTQPPADASECDIFQSLRIQLSSALKGVGLRQKLHEALQQAEEANQLKSRFLSMVSHELRTPLNLIVGLSEMALRQPAKGKKDTQAVLRKYHEQIYVSGQHLDRLIRDVLDLTSSQVGQMKLINRALDLLPVLQDAASMGSQLAEQKNLKFIFEVPERLPPVWGDKTRLRQVLLNLLSNAVKFTARGEITLRAEAQGDEILVTVKDTGLGIVQEDQAKIFDEFSQSQRTTVRGYGGIGLGLAITRLLIELHGGRIWVNSNGQEGSGSTFSFSLPVMTAQVLAEQETVSARQSTVLILTGAPGGAQKLSEFLSRQGFNVEEMALERQVDVVENLLVSPPGAVVLDLAPAAEQGWEIMRELKQNPATQDIPVLFYSLLVDQDAGAVVSMDYLTKPIGAEQLAQALRRHGLTGGTRKTLQTVLIVDDEPGILDLHTRMVQSQLANCHILTARDGKQGLELMREFLPDLVLLDLMMPVMDGFGVLKAMQDEQLLRSIPVIVLSGQVLTEHEMARLNKGVAAVLSKGVFTASEIMDRIEQTLARHRRLGTDAQRLVQQAMAYIHENYQNSISRREIAQHLCVNEQYLSRCFNKEVGIGPMAYLGRYRIEQAKRLLEKGHLSITQVAMAVGLSSQSYFSRLFQQETGVTPSAYLRGVRSGGENKSEP